MLRNLGCALLSWMLGAGVASDPERSTSLPLDAGADFRPLVERIDAQFQEALVHALEKRAEWARLIRAKKLSVGVVDLSDPEAPRLALVNGQYTMYAASLPKIAALYAAFCAIEDGTIDASPELAQDLEAMIRRSDNHAATRVIRRVGFDRIETELRNPRVALYDPDRGGGLWLGKAYQKGGVRRPDPVRGITHGANALQVCRFYYLLANGRLINPARSRQMLRLLSNTAIHHKFVAHLKDTADMDRVYRKSGSWKKWHSDSVLVWQEDARKYILVALVEDEGGEQILRELDPVIEEFLAHSSLA